MNSDLILSRNHEANLNLAESPNRKAIESKLRGLYKDLSVIKTIAASADREIQWIDRGLGLAEDIMLKTATTSEFLFSTFRFKKNNSIHIVNISLSPDLNMLVVATETDGSTDLFTFHVIDIESKKTISQELTATSNSIVWITPDQFVTQAGTSSLDRAIQVMNTTTNTITKMTGVSRLLTNEKNFLGSKGNNILLTPSKNKILLDKSVMGSSIGQLAGSILLQMTGADGLGELRTIPNIVSEIALKSSFFYPEEKDYITNTLIRSKYVIVKRRWGASRSIQVLDSTAVEIARIPVPDCCSLGAISWLVPGKKLSVTLGSVVKKSQKFIYDLESKTWDKENISTEMLQENGINYKSGIVQVTSADGQLVPMRMVYRENIKADGERPVLFAVYGGFEKIGSIDGARDRMMTEFINRGGIYAMPALRGGGEFGPEWHKSGAREKKINTMQDLIASARWMVANGWSNSKKIIAIGTSNGGLTVASAGLLAPDAFGLIIPVAGVHDMLNKENLDPDFGLGWSAEYGDSRQPEAKNWIEPTSPVSLASNLKPDAVIPNFMIIVGQNDSRVNP